MISLCKIDVLVVLLACVFWNAPTQLAGEPPASASGTATSLDTDPALIGWWRFDESSGRKASDSSSQAHDGILEGELSFDTHSAPGKVGKALRLDGSGQMVRVAGFKGITGTRARTVCLWVKTAADKGQIVAWGTDDHGKMWIFGHIRGRVGVTPKGGYLYINESIADDKWHHVAVVVDKADLPNLHDHVRLFKDGAPAVIHDIGLLDLWPIETGNQIDVQIGRGFKGLLDDLRIYERALSEEELGELFKLQNR